MSMECKDCVASLSEWVDGRLETAEAAGLESHLTRCASCSLKAREFKALNSVMSQALPQLEPPTARMWAAIQAQLPAREPIHEGFFTRAFKAIMANGLVLAPVPVALLIVAAYWAQPAPKAPVVARQQIGGTATSTTPQQRQIRQVVDDKRNESIESGFHSYARKVQQRRQIPQR